MPVIAKRTLEPRDGAFSGAHSRGQGLLCQAGVSTRVKQTLKRRVVLLKGIPRSCEASSLFGRVYCTRDIERDRRVPITSDS